MDELKTAKQVVIYKQMEEQLSQPLVSDLKKVRDTLLFTPNSRTDANSTLQQIVLQLIYQILSLSSGITMYTSLSICTLLLHVPFHNYTRVVSWFYD